MSCSLYCFKFEATWGQLYLMQSPIIYSHCSDPESCLQRKGWNLCINGIRKSIPTTYRTHSLILIRRKGLYNNYKGKVWYNGEKSTIHTLCNNIINSGLRLIFMLCYTVTIPCCRIGIWLQEKPFPHGLECPVPT